MTLSEQINNLFNRQLTDWPLANENYKALQNVLVRTVNYNDEEIRLQYNPKRIISSSARVDPKSLSERPCFLCEHNRPLEQRGIPCLNNYLILVNPYPIFSPHLTIPTIEHRPQRITGHFTSMLYLARELQDYTIIYNGPNCGASAPDHFHFQAVRRNVLPVESEYRNRLTGKVIFAESTEIFYLKDYVRKVLTICSPDESEIMHVFEQVFRILEESLPAADEPMMNILTWHENKKWIIHIFPRKQHRPSQYFETGEKQILLSPASIDMGGVLIIPRENDYYKITRDQIVDIFNQVCVDDFFIGVIMERLKKEL